MYQRKILAISFLRHSDITGGKRVGTKKSFAAAI